jgi:predicted MPP superfamily phosphohydrolase
MRLFILAFFAVYGSLHVYAFVRARQALDFGTGTGIVLGAFMLVMTLAPLLVRIIEGYEYELSAQILSHVAYLWMALLFLAFCSSVFIAVINGAFRTAEWISGRSLAGLTVPPRQSFFIATGLSLMICIYGYFSALAIKTERLKIETAKLPAHVDRLRIVQISDVHLGLIVRCDRLRKIMDIVKEEKPDVFVSTGDLVDAQIDHLTGLAELLQQVRAPYGNYAITGNHEYYAGLKQALDFTREAGFRLLRGESATDGVINIVGVNDPAGAQLNLDHQASESGLLSRLPKNRFTLLLKHRPTVDPATAGMFDLQLSGHTHKGQIFPFTWLSKMAYPMNAGLFHLPEGAILRVSRGTGTWGPPVRFLSPPEVTVIDLVRKPG